MNILIVDDDEITLDIIKNILESDKHEVRTVSDGVGALEVIETFKPGLILTDIEMPRMNGLELLARVREVDSETIVIIATAKGSEDYALQALRAGANDYLRKPVDQNLLLSLVHRYSSAIESKAKRSAVSTFITQSELSMTFGNRIDLIYEITDYLMDQAGNSVIPDELPMMRLGLAELITNAIEHGNLGINHAVKAEKMETGADYFGFIAERLSISPYKDRCVTIKSKIDEHFCEWEITDQGEGFDWQSVPDECTAESLFSSHGRGIILSRLQFDEVKYEGSGNKVTFKKRTNRIVHDNESGKSAEMNQNGNDRKV